jgi:hypothetical protein
VKQYCPICKQSVEPSRRYPRYVCEQCADKAVSADGRRVEFSNEDIFGGCEGQFVDTGETYGLDDCFIKGIKCRASEAHMGGIVIEAVE